MDKRDWNYYTAFVIGVFIDLIVIWAVMLDYIKPEENEGYFLNVVYSLLIKGMLGLVLVILFIPFREKFKWEKYTIWDNIKLYICLPVLPCCLLLIPFLLFYTHIELLGDYKD